jgi:uncharacterized protein
MTPPPRKPNWPEILIFYVIAVAVSAPFRLRWIHLDELFPLPYGLNVLYAIFRGIGPAVGFIVVVYLIKSKVERTTTFWGTNKFYSLLAVVIIPVGLTCIGVFNDEGFNEHYYGLIYGVTLVLYAIGEEYGWRGYLQEALAPMNKWQKILVIAVMWYVWHLNFLRPEVPLKTHLIHFVLLALGSWGLLEITKITKSILFAVAVHLSFNVISDTNANFNGKLAVLGVAIVVWIILIRNQKVNTTATPIQ